METKPHDKEFLTDRAIRFFRRYGDELESIRQLVGIRLDQLALAYTLQNDLPREAVQVFSRVKSLDSFLKKLEKKGWPDFYYPFEVATDIVGTRIICWFLDDCYGMLERLHSSRQFVIRERSEEDYIKTPKASGYRSIHLLADLAYDRVKKREDGTRYIEEGLMVCEVQVRTKLQDAWGEFTHEVHYKVGERFEEDYETLVAEIATRLASEDRSALALRDILRRKVEEKEHEGIRTGPKTGNPT